MDTFMKWEHNGKSGNEGVMNAKTKTVVRVDGLGFVGDTTLTVVSKTEARDKYGINTTGANSDYRYFLLKNGDVIDNDGDIRFKCYLLSN